MASTFTIAAPVQTARHSWLARWHLLSLDAPTVAVVWTWFVARVTHTPLPPVVLGAMFVAVWLLYAADRLLDTRHLDVNGTPQDQSRQGAESGRGPWQYELEPRHFFHHLHRRVFLVAIAAALVLLAWLLPWVPKQTLEVEALLAAVLFGWLAAVHLLPKDVRLPKELAAGVFFAGAVFVPVAPWTRPAVLPSMACFAAICTLNGVCIRRWEQPGECGRGRVLPMVLGMFGPVALAVWFGFFALTPALSLSALLLWMLDRYRFRFERTSLRAAADLALLTPLLIGPLLR